MSKFLFILLAAVLSITALQGKIILASGGKTSYTVVAPAKMNNIEKAAVKDLCYYLSNITKAKFKTGKAGEKNIFVGVKAPSDNKPLAAYERRMKSENGNIYLYGHGFHGNSNAIYDFLRKLGCQWYSFFGDCKIPDQQELILDDLDSSLIPDFKTVSYYGSTITQNSTRAENFRRRSGIYDPRNTRGGAAMPLLGYGYGHMPVRIVPPGKEYTKNEKIIKAKAVKYFENKAYFKTNPEYFSMDKFGKRIPNYQHCYSNPELRRTMIENYQIIFDNEYKGGPAQIFADLNDKGLNGMPCCWCSECDKLNKKYKSLAGSYWDFIFQLGNHFKDKYPEIGFRALVYGITLQKPEFPAPLPPNILLRIAPLGTTDFMKSYRDGGLAIDFIKKWSGVSNGGYMAQFYPTTYERPLWGRPLTANIQRLVQNMRDLHKYGVNSLGLEFGVGPHGTVWFNEMRLYLIARLSCDVDQDEKELIRDFMFNYYGKNAAPIMLKYYYELEKLEAAEPGFMRWWQDFRSALTYLTPENLLRWQGYFDEMLKVTAPHSRHALNIRRARQNLDEATIACWYKFAPGEMPDRDMLKKRHTSTAVASAKDMLRTFVQVNPKQSKAYLEKRLPFYDGRAFYYHYALSGKWKPLPEPFRSMPEKNILRTVPYINQKVLAQDPDAVTGIAVQGTMPRNFDLIMSEFRQEGRMKNDIRYPLKRKLTPEMVKKAPAGKYHLYYAGTVKIYPDCLLYTNGILRASGVTFGHLFDEKNPDQKYDLYLSLKLEKDGRTLWFDQAVFVKSNKELTYKEQ